jgi:hypothetical protein
LEENVMMGNISLRCRRYEPCVGSEASLMGFILNNLINVHRENANLVHSEFNPSSINIELDAIIDKEL